MGSQTRPVLRFALLLQHRQTYGTFRKKALKSEFRVTIVRHAETEYNVRQLVQGSSDGKLTKNGTKQAEELGRFLQNQVFTRVYSSDLARCQETVNHALKQLKAPVPSVVLDERLRERNFGEWDGIPLKDIFKVAKARNCNALDLVPPGGETSEEAYGRIVTFIEELIREVDTGEKDENVLVASHGLHLQYLMNYFNANRDVYELENFTFDKYAMPCNTARTTFHIEKKPSSQIMFRSLRSWPFLRRLSNAGLLAVFTVLLPPSGPLAQTFRNLMAKFFPSGQPGKRKINFICIFDGSHLSSKTDSHHVKITQGLKSSGQDTKSK